MMRFLPVLLLSACTLSDTDAVAADGAVVLMYHRFGDARFPATNIRESQLRDHLDYLQSNDYSVIPLEQLLASLEGEAALPEKAVVITVDDAYRSVYDTGHPILAEYDVPYTLFVSTDALDQRLPDYMSWEQLKDLAEQGVTIANHSASHESLLTHADAKADVQKAEDRLRAHVEILDGVFAYPYGEFDLADTSMLQSLGYEFAFGQHSGAVGRSLNRYALPRFPMNETYGSMDEFGTKVSSRPLPVASVTPRDPAVSQRLPSIEVRLQSSLPEATFSCFVGGQGAVPVDWQSPGTEFRVAPTRPLSPGRNRVNCTAPVGDGTYYWFSHPWFVSP